MTGYPLLHDWPCSCLLLNSPQNGPLGLQTWTYALMNQWRILQLDLILAERVRQAPFRCLSGEEQMSDSIKNIIWPLDRVGSCSSLATAVSAPSG